MKGPCGSDGGRRRYDAASPEPMYQVGTDGLSRTATPPNATHYRPTSLDSPLVRLLDGRTIRLPLLTRMSYAEVTPLAVRAAPCRMSDSLALIRSRPKA